METKLNKFGDFADGGKVFEIDTPDIPRNWYNYFWEDNFVSFTSQAGIGQAFLQDKMTNRIRPILERGAYIVVDDKGWNLAGLPVHEKPDFYKCTHGIGYTVIGLERNGIYTEYGLFVPTIPRTDRKVNGYEVAWVKVTNKTDRAKKCKVSYFVSNDFDSKYTYQGYNVRTLHPSKEINGMCFGVEADGWNGERVEFLSFLSACREMTGWDCARNAFIGPYGSFADPKAIHNGGCTNSSCIGEKMCFAVETALNLAPGESEFCSFVAGLSTSKEKINEICSRFSTEELVRDEVRAVVKKYRKMAGGLKFSTPDSALDCLANHWLPYQTNMGARWARIRHSGYRDIAQDSEALALFNPELAWRRTKRLLRWQYSNGYAPRTVEDGAIRDNKFSDCPVWITFTCRAVINELGDKSLYDEAVAFNDGSTASVYEHMKRSVNWLWNFRGLHGLIKIWGGDWNDCMDHVGKYGNGVSVWLSIAWYTACLEFIKTARETGHTEDAELYTERAKEMRQIIEREAFDEEGGYYIAAYNDSDRRIGAPTEKEGKIFLIPQLWAIFSGVGSEDHLKRCMDAVEKLLTYELGTAVSTPPYTHYDRGVGTMCIKSPGVQENGGVYLHPMNWLLMADCMLGDESKCEREINRILPFRNPVVAGRAEPYTLCNSYMGRETGYRYGTPGQSWRTASGQQFIRALINYVFGCKAELEGLKIEPCLPLSWQKAEITKPFRGGYYHICYIRTGNKKVCAKNEKGEKTDCTAKLLPLPEKGQTIEVICEV